MVGTVIDNYKVISVLGEGGMGVVYKVLDMKLERFVALKILNTQSLTNPQFIERFKREAKNQAKLTHPNIVPVYGFTEDAGFLGIAMEYVEGETVERLIYRMKNIPVRDALEIIKQVLSGVGYAHQKGFIHRDMKPSNIIINKEGIVKIMDFGISKSIFEKGITKTGAKIGTVLYMSPEQIKAEEPTRQSDIYSIGVTLYEMLTGKAPFDFGTEYEIMEAHLKKVPNRVSVTLNSIPPEVDKVVSKAMEKIPQKRYSDCKEFSEDVDFVLDKYDKPKKTKTKPETKEKTEGGFHKIKVTFLAIFILALFAGLFIVIFNVISDLWPNISELKNNHTTDTTATYNSNPSFQQKSNWVSLTSNTYSTLNSVYFIDDYTGLACGETGTIIKTSNGGENWVVLPTLDSLNFFDIKFSSAQNGFVVGEKGMIYHTSNLGESWTKIDPKVVEAFFRIYFLDDKIGFISGSNGVILKTNDGGKYWKIIRTPTSSLLYALTFRDENTGFAVGWNGTIIKTTNRGESWELAPSFTDKYMKDIFFVNKNKGFVSAAGGEIFTTTDGGDSWKKIETSTLSGLVSINFLSENRGYITSNKGEILETSSGGNSWTVNPSGNYFSLSKIFITPRQKVFIVGFNGTILKLKE